ncbi:MAG: RNA polymerase sigma factor RpoD/SigA [Planctomycetaceae bacterium]|nr:RNA polymerase sigma factor RpoD/SigA [Planctomycetaceae bacterium]
MSSETNYIIESSSTAVQSPLDMYLFEINSFPLLSAEEETELALAIAEGDIEARERMVRSNLRLVVNIARAYIGKGLSFQDLIEEGNLGLMRAVEGYDPSMGTRFSTYASYWIKQTIKRALINSGKTIRIPAYMVEILTKWRKASNRLLEELGRSPTPEETARVLGIARKKLSIIKKAVLVNNLVPQADQSETGWTMSEMVTDDRMKSPEEEILDNDNLSLVLKQVEQLNERDAAIVKMRFGLCGMEVRTYKEISALLGLTRERVRQICTEILDRMAEALNGHGSRHRRRRRKHNRE